MSQIYDYAYLMALSHLPRWGSEKINRLIIEILHNQKISFATFFKLKPSELKDIFELSEKQILDIEKAKSELPNYSFLAENLLEQGFNLIPFNSKEYSETLKQNLKIKNSPPLLEIKGNIKVLNKPSVAIIGTRKASEISLEFTRNIAKKCANNNEIVISGFAKGVDKMALDATLEYNGCSIIVLPQGILTFGGSIKKYYKKIINGDVLIVSTYYPNASWAVGLAISRNVYIYGLAEKIFIAESDNKGGTWTGGIDGIKKGRKIYIRKPEENEKNANDLLIMQGAIPVDLYGNEIKYENNIEKKLKEILTGRAYTAQKLQYELKIGININEIRKMLSNLDFIDSKKVGSKKYYFLKDSIPDLFI